MTEAEQLKRDMQAVYGELFPYRDPGDAFVSDSTLALALLLRREIRSSPYTTTVRSGAGVVPLRRTPHLTPRELDRISRYNPKDAE